MFHPGSNLAELIALFELAVPDAVPEELPMSIRGALPRFDVPYAFAIFAD
jgi:hypothetical protein